MIEENTFVDECTQQVELFLQEQNTKPESKKRFPVDGGSFGYVYQLGHFGVEITVHQFIIFSKYNSRYIDMVDYKNVEELMGYVLPIIQEYIDDPAITKHIFIRQLDKLKSVLSFASK
ncbi:MAG: hypothetical protein OEM38_12190 [Gammaproteobacteria bacterium]|nr:hypothetical protein [Gammaproteobacteria bacterium]